MRGGGGGGGGGSRLFCNKRGGGPPATSPPPPTPPPPLTPFLHLCLVSMHARGWGRGVGDGGWGTGERSSCADCPMQKVTGECMDGGEEIMVNWVEH